MNECNMQLVSSISYRTYQVKAKQVCFTWMSISRFCGRCFAVIIQVSADMEDIPKNRKQGHYTDTET